VHAVALVHAVQWALHEPHTVSVDTPHAVCWNCPGPHTVQAEQVLPFSQWLAVHAVQVEAPVQAVQATGQAMHAVSVVAPQGVDT
jgi:hypothetical protein